MTEVGLSVCGAALVGLSVGTVQLVKVKSVGGEASQGGKTLLAKQLTPFAVQPPAQSSQSEAASSEQVEVGPKA